MTDDQLKRYFKDHHMIQITKINYYRDGGTVELDAYSDSHLLKYYVSMPPERKFYHSSVTPENEITDRQFIEYLLHVMERYIEKQEESVFQNKILLRQIEISYVLT
jgi:hypothetical protein